MRIQWKHVVLFRKKNGICLEVLRHVEIISDSFQYNYQIDLVEYPQQTPAKMMSIENSIEKNGLVLDLFIAHYIHRHRIDKYEFTSSIFHILSIRPIYIGFSNKPNGTNISISSFFRVRWRS